MEISWLLFCWRKCLVSFDHLRFLWNMLWAYCWHTNKKHNIDICWITTLSTMDKWAWNICSHPKLSYRFHIWLPILFVESKNHPTCIINKYFLDGDHAHNFIMCYVHIKRSTHGMHTMIQMKMKIYLKIIYGSSKLNEEKVYFDIPRHLLH